MAGNLFSITIFFIVFRETLEAAIIISVLLGLIEQIARPSVASEEQGIFVTDWRHPNHPHHQAYLKDHAEKVNAEKEKDANGGQPDGPMLIIDDSVVNENEESNGVTKRLIRRLRLQILLGSALGLLIALAIGAAFIAIFFTEASDLWAKTEEVWEGVFSLIASLIILAMGLTMLKLDRARVKWRVKLLRAIEKSKPGKDGLAGQLIIFFLPFITVLREGLEAVVFVGGVSLGQSARSIPIAAIVGIICGLVCGFLIYAFASRSTLIVFLVIMTNFLLLIGAGLFSRSVGNFQTYRFNKLLGADVDDSGGDGPGSYDVRGVVWHLDCCNPENNSGNQGWKIFNALFGWTNTATIGTVLAYVFYWIAVIALVVYMKFAEGRIKLLGYEGGAYRRRRAAKADVAAIVRKVPAEEAELSPH
ncbi:iron permease FTR1 [Sanghuangporus baumii]|uniref:Iron permease FTR1 n=1 Tax=Sanghuangporus baumii TaxID=108892 RepID=A0A9Q5NB77_SANBA|nr:iron permease FTR1 [Sanghuangporus baumii]